MKGRVRDIITGFLLHVLWICPVDTKKIIFKSFRGQNCGDSPGAIFQELKKRRPDLHYYWVMRDTSTVIPGASVIRNGSIVELFHLATAKVWVDNKRKGMWCTKRKKQYYIQTWHAGISGKKVEADARGALSDYYLKMPRRILKMRICSCPMPDGQQSYIDVLFFMTERSSNVVFLALMFCLRITW